MFLLLSWTIWTLELIWRSILILLLLIWRLIIAFFVSGRSFIFALWANRILTAILLGVFAAGLPMQIFQEEIMSAPLDIPYVCGVYPTAQIVSSFTIAVTRTPYEFLAENWNVFILSLYDGAAQAFGVELKQLVKQGRVASTRVGIVSVVRHAFLMDELEEIADVLSDVFNALSGYFEGYALWVIELWEFLVLFIETWFIRFDMFGLSCSMCSADVNHDCPIRDAPDYYTTPSDTIICEENCTSSCSDCAFNCDECHEIQASFWQLFGSFLDAITGNFVDFFSENTSKY